MAERPGQAPTDAGPTIPIDEILERCRRRDPLAWEALVRRFQGRVYGVTRHYLRDDEEARDLAQEVFVRIYEKLDTFHGHETFLAWTIRLTRNLCIDHIRRVKARPPLRDVPVETGPELRDRRPSPERELEAATRRDLVHRALEKLSDPYREIILLKDIQGLKLEEIAKMLDLPLGTVKSRSNRARLELARTVLKMNPHAGGAV